VVASKKNIAKKITILCFSFFIFLSLPFRLYAYNFNADPYARLTPEQIAKHPTDKWFTAERPDFTELDERVKTLAKNEDSPQAVARIICEGMETDLEKTRAIFAWISFNIAYDTSYTIYHGETTFAKRRGVCNGYAELFQLMAEEIGLKSRLIVGTGYGIRRDRHAWNLVKLPERDLLLDSCWGAGSVSGSRFKFSYAPWWFDTHPAIFVYTHLPDKHEDELIYPYLEKKGFNSLQRIEPNDYYPYGNLDPIEDYHNRFCKNKENLPVTFSSYRGGYLWSKYISTGPQLTDGFFISDYEVPVYFLEYYLEEGEVECIRDKYYEHKTTSAVSDLPLHLIAKYCNGRSKAFDLDECYTITGDEEKGYTVSCDYSKCGFRLPTKKEWLTACGTKYLDPQLSEKDFSDAIWYNKNSIDRIRIVKQTKANENHLYDMLGNVSELCFDEETGNYVFMGGNIHSTREEIQSLTPVPFDDYKTNKGYHGFRIVFNAPETADHQYEIAKMYKDSTVLESIPENYKLWLKLAIENGNPNAMVALARECYEENSPQSLKKCYDLCITAAKSEQTSALFILGQMYKQGLYVDANEKTAFEYYERAANAGNLTSKYLMSQYYKEGKIVPKDDDKYFYWMRKAVFGGYDDDDLKTELAQCYRYGKHCDPDPYLAFTLFKEVAEKEDAPILALVECADCYLDGIGCRPYSYDAVYYYKKAMEKGSIYAKAKLGDCAFYGQGMTRDIEYAVNAYREIIDGGYGTESYNEKYALYKKTYDIINSYDDKCKNYFHNIPEQGDIEQYIQALASVSELAFDIQGTEMTNSALLRGLKLEQINSQIIEPMKKVAEGKSLSGKTIVIINPYKGKQYSGIQQEIFTYDCFNSKKYCVNGEYYRYDKSFFEYYNNIILLQKQEENLNSVDTAFQKLMPCLAGCDEVDLMLFSTDYFKEDSDYVFEYKKIAEKMADKGTRPRIIVFGNKTDSIQQNINRIFSGDEQKYAEKINVFGTPCNMKEQLSCGFRNDKLFIVLLTERISSRSLLLYLDETGWAPEPNRKDVSFIQSQSDLSKMAGMGLNKGGTISKPGKMVMHYKVVK
jgi:TPR repeat protein